MRGRYLGPAIRIGLSSLLIVTATMSPAVRHCHVVGEIPHRHEGVFVHHHHDRGIEPAHDHGHDNVSPDRRVSGPAEHTTALVTHVHLSCLGFEITLPVPSIPEESEQNDSGTPAVFVQMIDGSVDDGQPRSGFDRIARDLSADQYSMAVPVCEVARYASTPTIAAPLCDAARHERSGVQLI